MLGDVMEMKARQRERRVTLLLFLLWLKCVRSAGHLSALCDKGGWFLYSQWLGG